MMSDSPALAHWVPGRVRVRVPQIRGNPDEAAALADRIIELPGVNEVRASSRTGSVVVLFDETEEPPSADVLHALGLDESALAGAFAALNDADTALVVQPPAVTVGRWFQQMNDRVDERTGGIDLRFIVPAVLFALSLRQLARQPVGPPWYNLLWYAFSTFRSLNAQRLGKR